MNGIFSDLEDEGYFVERVTKQFCQSPREISVLMHCDHVVDIDRIKYAHVEYLQNIEKFSVLLSSQNPDHYKRSGSLLHALYQSQIVQAVFPEFTMDDIECGMSRVPYAETTDIIQFLQIYTIYFNEFLSFDFAYRVCAMYEDEPTIYDRDYVHNMCHFLSNHPTLSVDACFMLFKSLMQKTR